MRITKIGQASGGRHRLQGAGHVGMTGFRGLHQRELSADGGQRLGGDKPAVHGDHDVFERHRVPLGWRRHAHPCLE